MSNQITVQQAAQHLNVEPRQIRQWLRSGKLQGTKDSGGWMVSLTGNVPATAPAQSATPPSPRRTFTAAQRRTGPSLFKHVQLEWNISDKAMQGELGPRYTSAILLEVTRRAHGLSAHTTFGFPGKKQTAEVQRAIASARE